MPDREQLLRRNDAAVDRVARLRAAEDRKDFDTAADWMREKYRNLARGYLKASLDACTHCGGDGECGCAPGPVDFDGPYPCPRCKGTGKEPNE